MNQDLSIVALVTGSHGPARAVEQGARFGDAAFT